METDRGGCPAFNSLLPSPSRLSSRPGIWVAIRSLTLVSEVIHGTPSRFRDPARFSFAHGGKDGHPFPVPTRVYDESIDTLKDAVQRAKLGRTDKIRAIRCLDRFVQRAEKSICELNLLCPLPHGVLELAQHVFLLRCQVNRSFYRHLREQVAIAGIAQEANRRKRMRFIRVFRLGNQGDIPTSRDLSVKPAVEIRCRRGRTPLKFQ